MRGIASLMVVLHHCALGFAAAFLVEHIHHANVHSPKELALYGIVRLLSLGRSSVIMFFVLSGFVLSYSLAGKATPYGAYFIRRVFRIYPVFLIAVVASYGLHCYLDGPQPFGLLLGHLAMLGTKRDIALDPAVWSLNYEMRISLLFPLLFWAVARFRLVALAVTFVLSLGCTVAIHRLTGFSAEGFNDTTVGTTWLETGYFIFFFALGSFVASDWTTISAWLTALSPAAKTALIAAFCVVLLLGDGGDTTYKFSGIEYLRGFSAAGLIALAIGFPRFAAVLGHGLLMELGRISYSLYLIHMPIIYWIAAGSQGGWSPLLASAVAVGISLVGAALLFRFVELPGIALGKRVAGKFNFGSGIAVPRTD